MINNDLVCRGLILCLICIIASDVMIRVGLHAKENKESEQVVRERAEKPKISCEDVVRCKKGTEFWNEDHTKGLKVVSDITMCEEVIRSKYFSPLGREEKPMPGGIPPDYLNPGDCQSKGK